MNTFAKIMVVVNFVLAIAFLATAGTLHGATENWKAKDIADVAKAETEANNLREQVKARQADLDAARAEAASFRTDAESAKSQLKQLNEQNAMLARELETKNGEIAKLISANADSSGSVKDLTARNQALSSELAQKDAEKKQTEEKLRTSDENLARETARADNAEKAAAAAEARIVSMTDQLDAMNTQLVAYAHQFGPLSDVAVVEPVKGVVQAASAKDDVFVISVGQKDKVKVGYEFTVSRGDHYVSTIVVDAVFPNHATGHTKSGMKKMDVQAGDSVATKTGL